MMNKGISKKQLQHLIISQNYFYGAIRNNSLEKEESVSYLKEFVKYSGLRSKDKKFHKEHVYDDTLWNLIQNLTTTYSDFGNEVTFESLRNDDILDQFCEAYGYVETTLIEHKIIKKRSIPFVSSILSAVFGITPIINNSLLKALGISIKAGIKAIIKKMIEVYDRNPEKFRNAIHSIGEFTRIICEGILGANGIVMPIQASFGVWAILRFFKNDIDNAIDATIERLRSWAQ